RCLESKCNGRILGLVRADSNLGFHALRRISSEPSLNCDRAPPRQSEPAKRRSVSNQGCGAFVGHWIDDPAEPAFWSGRTGKIPARLGTRATCDCILRVWPGSGV